MPKIGVYVPANYVRALRGNCTAAVILAQMVYWQKRNDGEFFVTAEQLEKQTGVGRRGQANARKLLVQLGILYEKRRGVPAKLYFSVDLEALEALLQPDKADVTHVSEPVVTHEAQPVSTDGAQPVVPHGAQQDYTLTVQTNEVKETKEEIKEETKKGAAPDFQSDPSPPPSPSSEVPVESTPPAEPLPPSPFTPSSEDRFALEYRLRAQGKQPPSSIELAQWPWHLAKTIGADLAKHPRIKASFLNWYAEFGEEFVEKAWELSFSEANKLKKKRSWVFIDIFDDYSRYPELAKIVRERADKHATTPDPDMHHFVQGEAVIYKGAFYTVDETSNEGRWLELRSDSGEILHDVPAKQVFSRQVVGKG
jgi:hypothetical protein